MRNGQNTKSFIADGSWKYIADNVKVDDYVLIQFVHSNEVFTKANYIKQGEFTANLILFINETKAKNANPMLITPVVRRKFDANGHIVGMHDEYAELVRKIAASQQVPLIDLDKESQSFNTKIGG